MKYLFKRFVFNAPNSKPFKQIYNIRIHTKELVILYNVAIIIILNLNYKLSWILSWIFESFFEIMIS